MLSLYDWGSTLATGLAYFKNLVVVNRLGDVSVIEEFTVFVLHLLFTPDGEA
jgi:hypothetical protein